MHSTLVALSVPENELIEVAEHINAYSEVTHNYHRNHKYNLWFTLSCKTHERLEEIIQEVRGMGYPLLDLRTRKVFKVDVIFDLTNKGI